MHSDVAISVKNLSKTYRVFGHPGDRIKQALTLGHRKYHKEFTALHGISFEIKKGATVGIIGRNGSGKSTLLQLICGILKPTSGSAEVSGRISALLELGAGFNPEFTGRENVYFQGAVMGLTKQAMDERFDRIAAFADIGEFIDQPVRTFSSGMYVRLAFAAAVFVDPDILVVDEALSVGDAEFQAKCFGKFREFREKGVTILFVTHSLDLVAAHCEHVVLLDRGQLVCSDNPQSALNEYRRRVNDRPAVRTFSSTGTTKSAALRWDTSFSYNPSEVRYGSRDTEIIEAGLFMFDNTPTQILHYGDEYLLKIRVLWNRSELSAFMSFVVKDLRGAVLSGTTTLLEGVHVQPVLSGQILEVVFQMQMLLNPGHYFLSVGSQSYDSQAVSIAHDHRSDYLPFEVLGQVRYGVFASPMTVTLKVEHESDATC